LEVVENPNQLRERLLADRSLKGSEWAKAYSLGVDRWARSSLSSSSPTALVALGSYGRQELCPWSDLDLILLHDRRIGGRELDRVADAVWYPIWDLGVGLDHSVKTYRDAISVANDDPRALLGQLDARPILGDAVLAQRLIVGIHEHFRKNLRRFGGLIEGQVRKRHAESGELADLLEPDLKSSRGGLRDLQIVRSFMGAVEVPGAPSEVELNELSDFLLMVRVELHRSAGRVTDRLGLQEADTIAEVLGYQSTDALMRDLSECARSVSSSLRECFRSIATLGRESKPRRVEIPGLFGPPLTVEIIHGRIRFPEVMELPTVDPLGVLRLARKASVEELGFERRFLEELAKRFEPPPTPWPAELLDEFVGLLGSGAGVVEVVQALDGVGVFQRYLPDWRFVRAKPQRNAFHRYSVDRHLLEAVIEASQLRRRVHRPDLLILAALFHDLGKGLGGDHSENGERIVEEIGPMMGLDSGDQETLRRLVRYHLLLVETALRRDTSDPVTLNSVAERVVDLSTLELLAALTEADLKATGTLAWTGWKATVVGDLVERVRRLLSDGALADPTIFLHGELLSELVSLGRKGAAVLVQDGCVYVAAPDRPGLLSLVAGALTLASISIASADIFGVDTVAIERLRVVSWVGGQPNVDRFKVELAKALSDEELVRQRISARARERRPPRRSAPLSDAPAPRVVIDPSASERATMIEVLAPDRHGLLYDLTSVIAELGFDIRHAKMATLGDDVIDTFYVTNATQRPLTPREQSELRVAVNAALGL
jgi:[protein-PII] uridylyltransferase